LNVKSRFLLEIEQKAAFLCPNTEGANSPKKEGATVKDRRAM
jgi:hypothetical protein